ncbi:HAD family hydrolase [Ramlibacter alkalitolerans]|uniref:HAD family phosphatase n=1 Tax=Ramlibacter alkalitolerans TaxID=2039631 RepID=A0ABS1JWR2_9BURK|nr:HAD family phosphatase [Ramlibacter alkalitolerans]MBL0428296.1 HAD family phosphatase [Ramlibacter alkalitolerans]
MKDPQSPVRAVLFDLGGVVLDVDFARPLTVWQPHSRLSPEELRAAFRQDDPYLRHETGALSADGFLSHLRDVLALDCDADIVRAGFNAMLVAEIEETVRLLEAIRADVPCYAISNTNPVHVAEIERAFPTLLPRFARVFVSHEIGQRKPDAAAFRHVLDAIGVAAPEALLFDDLLPNIEAARAIGMQAVQVGGPEDVRRGLEERGLLERPA